MKKLKICYIAPWNGVHTQRWLRYFARKGHLVHLISDNPCKCKELEGVVLHNFSFKNEKIIKKISQKLYLFMREQKAIWLLKMIKPDILHAHFLVDYGWLGAKTGFHPFVLTLWGSDIYIYPKQSKENEAKAKFVLSKADLVTSPSQDLRRVAIGLGASPDNYYIILWGVDLSRFNTQIDGDEVRKNLNIKSGDPVVLSLRSFKPLYNIDIIIQAIPYVLNEIPYAKFILINNLKGSYGDEERKIRELADRLKIGDAVKFVSAVEHEELPKYYRACDVYVSVPSSDGCSVSLLEAMACGIPPIVSDLPSPKEWVKDGESSCVVPVRDPIALAHAIISLLKDKEKQRLFAQRNLILVKEKADHYVHMQHMEELYFKLVKNFKTET